MQSTEPTGVPKLQIYTFIFTSVFRTTLSFLQHPKFDDIVDALELQKRGSAGEHTAAVDDIYDLSNKARLKKTEVKML